MAVSVNYATSNGSAVAGQDYTAVAGTLTFPPTATDETFLIPILSNPNRSTSFSTVNLALSQPVGGATLGTISSSTLTITNNNLTVKTFVVNNTGDSGLGTLRQAILDANADQSSGVDNIVFDIPASTAANLNVPVAGFDPSTQTWTIGLNSPLPVITHAVAIDGYTQANIGVGFRYPSSLTSQVDNLAVGLSVTGGTYILSIAPYVDDSGMTRGGVTQSIPYNATAAFVQNQLVNLVGGVGNVTVTALSQNNGAGDYVVSFTGRSTGLAIDLQVKSQSLTPTNVPITIAVLTQGGNPLTNTPTVISSVPNTVQALDGNNAQVRVIIDGSNIASGPSDIGFVINASNSILRGLAIEGFNVGVFVPNPTNVGDLIQGNFIGEYLAYPVDPTTGIPLPAPDTVELIGQGNSAARSGARIRQRHCGGHRSAGRQCDRRQRSTGHLDRAGRLRQPGAGQPDWRGRTIDEQSLLPGRQRRGRGFDLVVRNRVQSRRASFTIRATSSAAAAPAI